MKIVDAKVIVCSPGRNFVFPHAYSFKDGFMHPGEAPGIGVDIDEKLRRSIRISAPTCQ